MKESFVVNAELRTDHGKAASRRLRRTGKVPAIVYGGKDPAQQIALRIWADLAFAPALPVSFAIG